MNNIKNIELLIKNTIKNTEWENIVYIAGGYVRDEIMGKIPIDLDLLIDKPDGGIEFANWIVEEAKIGKDSCIFPRFGTAKFSINSFDIEAVMPRGENYTSGSRKPDVYHTSLKDDAFRRDFTINSLFKNISTGEILDFTGKGLDDIKNKKIRTPIDPQITFKDDPLRMLRAFRFLFKLDFSLSKEVFYGIISNKQYLKNISMERITDEFNKMLLLNNPDIIIIDLRSVGILDYIIPELEAGVYMEQSYYHNKCVFMHTLDVLKNTKPVLNQRLMALFHDIAKPKCKTIDETEKIIRFKGHAAIGTEMTKEIMSRMKYPNDIIKSVALGVGAHMRLKSSGNSGLDITDKALRRFKFDIGDDLEDVLDLIHADNISHAKDYCMPNQIENIRKRIYSLNIKTLKPALPINGHEIMEIFNIKQGKKVGELLSLIEDKYMENPGITKDECVNFIKISLC